MSLDCPRCRHPSPSTANFCGHCGLRLIRDGAGVRGAGKVQHPEPLQPAVAAWTIDDAEHLHFRWQAVGGGKPLLGTEPLEVDVFNGGYDLVNVVLRIEGHDAAGKTLFGIEREIEQWLRGQSLTLQIPSWELPDPVSTLGVRLVWAEFGAEE